MTRGPLQLLDPHWAKNDNCPRDEKAVKVSRLEPVLAFAQRGEETMSWTASCCCPHCTSFAGSDAYPHPSVLALEPLEDPSHCRLCPHPNTFPAACVQLSAVVTPSFAQPSLWSRWCWGRTGVPSPSARAINHSHHGDARMSNKRCTGPARQAGRDRPCEQGSWRETCLHGEGLD